MEVVAIDVGDPSLEQVAETRVGVLADGDQEVGAEVGSVDAGGELVGEPLRSGLAGAVEEVFLELVKHEEQARVCCAGGGLDGGVQPVGRQLGIRVPCEVRPSRGADCTHKLRNGIVFP